ncbi:MAG: hypothetical protein V4586_14085 [Pseudomonadota bacterium]
MVVAAIALHRHPEMTFGGLAYLAGITFIWPLQLPVVLTAIWYLGALAGFLFWKYLELVQLLTGLPVGRRMGRSLASDRFLINFSRHGPYGWLHRKALAVYPAQTAGDANG